MTKITYYFFIWSNTGDPTSRKANTRGFLPWPTVHDFFSSFAMQEFFRVIADPPPPPPQKKKIIKWFIPKYPIF